jgi:predicted secreted protein
MQLWRVLLLACLPLAVAASAADLPNAPSVTRISAPRIPLADPARLSDPALPDDDLAEFAPLFVMAAESAHPKKVLDRKFIALTTVATSLTVMDYEMTQRCLARRTCVETDPLLPHSRAGMYGTNIPLNATLFYWSYRWKARGKRLWWLPAAAVIASHAVGIGTNIRFLK